MMEQRKSTSGGPVLAVNAKQLGAMLGLSVRTIRVLDSSGKLPEPVVIGARSVRWVVKDIESWLQLGCPDRATWEAMQQQRRAR